MNNVYYSYCCGKTIDHLGNRQYICSRCKKSLTVYGNPINKEDIDKEKERKHKIREENGIRGSKYEVLPNGDLVLINKVYKKAELKEFISNDKEPWVVFDLYGNYITSVYVEHLSNARYMENDAFGERPLKAKLCAITLCYYNFDKYDRLISKIDDLKNNSLFKKSLIERGWKFDKNGKVK